MSAQAASRSIAYSADTAGRAGKIACHVVRSHFVDDGRVGYSIVVHNDTPSEAQASAFMPAAMDSRHRTLAQATVGPYSDFSTSVDIELARYGGIPELHIALSGDDMGFALIVPNARIGAEVAAVSERVAVAVLTASTNSRSAALPRNNAVSRAHARTDQQRAAGTAGRITSISSRGSGELARGRALKSPAAIPMFAVFAAIMLVIAGVVFRPQVPALVVPAQVPAATSVQIGYRATGIGTVSYRVLGPDAQPVAGGPLATGSGTFAVTLPRLAQSRAYIVRVAITGPFGGAFADDYVRIPAVLIPAKVVRVHAQHLLPPPQIRSFAVDRAAVLGGETLNVYYDVAASSGTIALVDPGSQIAYGKSQLSASGHTGFVVPGVQTMRSFDVVLTAQRGAAVTQSRIAVTATPQSSPTPQADTGDAGDSSSNGGRITTPEIVAPKTVGSGQPIRVDVHDSVAGLVLILDDQDGSELTRRELGASKSSTLFTAPIVMTPTRIRLQAMYPQGSGSETLVQTIVVVPR